MKVGDIVTGYHKGIHKITKIDRRFYLTERDIPNFLKQSVKVGDEMSPIVHYVRVLQEDGSRPKQRKNQTCDMSYCRAVGLLYNRKEKDLARLKEELAKLERAK